MLRYWKQFEETSKANNKIVKAFLKVVRRHLTPPPSSTNVGPDSLFARKHTDGKLRSWLAIKKH